MTIMRNHDTPILSPQEFANGIQAEGCSWVATMAWLVWDICITMDQEVELVWSQPWSFTKALYFFVRYMPTVIQCSTIVIGSPQIPGLKFTPHECLMWQAYQLAATTLVIMAVEYILLLRIDALYYQCRPIKLAVRAAYFIEVICMGVGIGLALPNFRFDETCDIIETPPPAIVYGAVTPVFQTILFVLTANQFFGVIRVNQKRASMVELLMRDGTWAFVLLEALLCGNGVLYLTVDHPYSSLLFTWLQNAFSFVGYRLILNLRHMPPSGNESQRVTTASICFAPADQPLTKDNVLVLNRRSVRGCAMGF